MKRYTKTTHFITSLLIISSLHFVACQVSLDIDGTIYFSPATPSSFVNISSDFRIGPQRPSVGQTELNKLTQELQLTDHLLLYNLESRKHQYLNADTTKSCYDIVPIKKGDTYYVLVVTEASNTLHLWNSINKIFESVDVPDFLNPAESDIDVVNFEYVNKTGRYSYLAITSNNESFPSSLYRWESGQENFTLLQEFPTTIVDWEYFQVSSVNNIPPFLVGSTLNRTIIYQLDPLTGRFNELSNSNLPQIGCTQTRFFSFSNTSFIAIVTNSTIEVLLNLETTWLAWDKIENLSSITSLQFFVVGKDKYMALCQGGDLSDIGMLYKWDGFFFVSYQNLTVSGCQDISYFQIDDKGYLLFASSTSNVQTLYKYNPYVSEFDPISETDSPEGVKSWTSFKLNDATTWLAACFENTLPVIYELI